MAAQKGNKYAAGNSGRPSGYDPEYHPRKAFKLALLGVSDKDIAHIFDITAQTFKEWKKQYKELSLSLLDGRIDADAEIAHSLYHRAKGYEHKETVFHVVRVDKDLDEVKATETIKHYPPDTKAIALFLANRTKAAEHRWVERPDNMPAGGPLVPGAPGSVSVPGVLTFQVKDPFTNTTSNLDLGGDYQETEGRHGDAGESQD